jgi:hypothetical protein
MDRQGDQAVSLRERWARAVAQASDLDDASKVLALTLAVAFMDDRGLAEVSNRDLGDAIGRDPTVVRRRRERVTRTGWMTVSAGQRRRDPTRYAAQFAASTEGTKPQVVGDTRWGHKGGPNELTSGDANPQVVGDTLSAPNLEASEMGTFRNHGHPTEATAPSEASTGQERLEGESAQAREDVTMAAPAVQADPRPEGVAAGGTDPSAPGSPPQATTEGLPRCAHCRFPLDPVLVVAEPWHDTHPSCDPRARAAA